MTRRPRTRIVILAVVALILVMATIHFTINGFPELGSLNPHSR
ncbi:hypothetical protein [Sinomonas sp. ASV322]|nr:hypothetical protein [Sinomonas sp. ASV322]MDQ4500767.1 hypothetical protein [Sinomonas sp. ASV322]